MPSLQQPIGTCAERLMTVKVRGSARCAHCTGSNGAFSCGMATGFNPTTGSASCGGGHPIVAVIAFCWREPHADMCRPQIEQAEKTQRRQPVRGPLTG